MVTPGPLKCNDVIPDPTAPSVLTPRVVDPVVPCDPVSPETNRKENSGK